MVSAVGFLKMFLSWVDPIVMLPLNLILNLEQKSEKVSFDDFNPQTPKDCADSTMLRKMSRSSSVSGHKDLIYLCKKYLNDEKSKLWGPSRWIDIDKRLNKYGTNFAATIPPGFKSAFGIFVFMGICGFVLILFACVIRKFRGKDIPNQSFQSYGNGHVYRRRNIEMHRRHKVIVRGAYA